jgi:hypothetical protein
LTVRQFSFALGILVLFFLNSSVSAETFGTIVTKAGDRFENVEINVQSTFKVVTFVFDGKKKSISFHKIAQVFDSDGNDITGELLGNYESKKNETWKSGTDPEMNQPKEKPWNIGIQFDAGFGIPIGVYYDGIDPGFSLGGDVIIAINYRLDLRFMVAKCGPRLSSEYDPLKFSAMRYEIAIQYHAKPVKLKPIWYVYSGLGAVDNRFTLDSYGKIYSETKFAMCSGGGVIISMAEKLGLDLGAHFDWEIIGSAETTYGTSTLQTAMILDFNIGIVKFF